MLTMPQHLIIEPTPGLLASVSAFHWIDRTPPGHVAYLLITHPTERQEDDTPQVIEARMRGLAAALRLATAGPTLPDMGRRLHMHYESDVIMSLDGCPYDMRIPIGGEWARFVSGGGTVTVAIGLDPLPVKSPKTAVAAYVVNRWHTGRLLLGKARATHLGRSTPRHAPAP